MDKNFKYAFIISIVFVLTISISLLFFHNTVYNSISTHYLTTMNSLENLNKETLCCSNIAEKLGNKHSERYYNFLQHYYETQNNWLNYWLTTMGIILTIMGIVIPYIFSKRWRDEKEELNNIKEKYEKEIFVAEDKLNRLDVNKTKQDFDKIIEDKKVEINDVVVSATDDLWQKINNEKDDLIKNTKATIIEDILKNGPDTEYFLDKLLNEIRESVEKLVDDKLKEGSDYD